MGGSGSGGCRVGSGRKPKAQAVRALHGTKRRLRAAEASARGAVALPADLSDGARGVWGNLAPHAREARTLTVATAAAFADLCEAIVSKRAMAAQIARDGLTYLKVTVDGAGQEQAEIKAHPLIAQHRGMMQRVETGLLRFGLSPNGKPLESALPVEVDPFAEFDTIQ